MCVCDCVQVNIACAFRGIITSVGVSRLGVAHPLWENISSAGYTSVDDSHSGREVEDSRLGAGIVLFVKLWKELVLAYVCVCNRVCN